VAGKSELIPTAFGALEYAMAGNGPSLLMIHGTGGGFDQGLTFADAIMRRGHRIISPSRFGYLRSAFPDDPSSENQADAFVRLLDHLRIDRLPVAGGSAGALSAAQFALRHRDRCSGLILLVPAANVSGRDPVRMSPFQQFLVEGLVRSDILYWAALEAAPDRLVGTLLATDPRLLAQVGAQERRRAYRILEELMPISARSRGMLNDGRLAGRPARMDFGRIDVPTLVVSVEDDRFGTAATAREIASVVKGARLVIYPSGGHIWLGHDGNVADEVTRFVASIAKLNRRVD
jgi:2-hydroxy-6-oxonona-2,4-dienedioate hydrolase